MKHLIQDKKQFDKFIWNVLPDLQKDEAYFISLSARKKYLTEKERNYYNLGRTEMYARKVVRTKDNFKFVMGELSAIFSVRKTKSGLSMPEKPNVVYVNINPVGMVKAVTSFKTDMDREFSQIVNSLMGGGNPNYDALRFADRKLLNHIQKSKGRRTWLDVDVDSLEKIHLNYLLDRLMGHKVVYQVVETHGGFHVLINRDSLNSSGCQLHKYVKTLNMELKTMGKECIFNKNGMIPMPGTLQAEKLVRLLKF